MTSVAQYPGALWIPTTHYWSDRGGQRAAWIILHGTAGFTTAQQVGQFFQNNDPPTSVHYVVGQDGTIVQCVAEEYAAWGNGVLSAGHDPWWQDSINPNLQTLSIEHVKPDRHNATPLTPAQEKASFELVAYLCRKWGIPARAADATGGVTGHYSVDPVNRAFCPGVYPWDALWTYLKGASVGIPHGWHDSANGDANNASGILTGPNGVKVTQGFRYLVLTTPWAPENIPLTNAHEHNPCDPTDPQSGDGTNQLFAYLLTVWQKSSNKIFTVPAGKLYQHVPPTVVVDDGKYNRLKGDLTALLSKD